MGDHTMPELIVPNSYQTALRRFLNILYPPQCLKCGAPVADSASLCASCWPEIPFVASPQCEACGLPFEFDLGPGALCGACTQERPSYDQARAAFLYTPASREMVLRYKHADSIHMTKAFAAWMIRAGSNLIDESDLAIPVPLHWSRLLSRRYNQAALLAQAIGKKKTIPVNTNILLRRKKTKSQGYMTRPQRHRNLQGAFHVPVNKRQILKDKTVLLVDDVMTSGATVNTCARVLKRHGTRKVNILTLARVSLERSL